MSSTLLHYYRFPGDNVEMLLQRVQAVLPTIRKIHTEYCFNVEVTTALSSEETRKLLWLFAETYEPEHTGTASYLHIRAGQENTETIIEVGPRLAFSTAWSSNCVSMCHSCGILGVTRIERSRRYKLIASEPLTDSIVNAFIGMVHDRMTECVYPSHLTTFTSTVTPEPVTVIPIMEQGKTALETLNRTKGLGFDDWDLEFYTNMFQTTLKRNPTDVECFDLGQSNSEHSRHWFFGGKMVIDGQVKDKTLFQMVKATLQSKLHKEGESNSIIAFHDNSSAIHGYTVSTLRPSQPAKPSPMQPASLTLHPLLTAETHNFPTGVAPFPGAETGTGGRLRDVQATGRGAQTLAGISAYCVGQLHIPEHPLPWETESKYSATLASPLDIQIQASNGASDYGNKFGEPVVAGFSRSFGMRLPSGERYEWIKPVMFTAGVGLLDARHSTKGDPEEGMVVCKVGGPAYRIGMGGGAASSRVSGGGDASVANLDFNAVQRGDAEMENRMNRLVRCCVEMGDANPIVSIHDQGAGGNGNVLKEIVDPKGAMYELRDIPSGDSTLSVMELWGAEYQENNAILVEAARLKEVVDMGKRENCAVSPVGTVTTSGRVIVHDSKDDSTPFDLPLALVLGKMPQKSFTFTTPALALSPLQLPPGLTVKEALHRVLQLVDVGSKRFLTNKVDRSVTGLVAQQQCVGPLHTPLADVAVLALSHFDTKGMATAVGEQPIKGLVSSAAQARMTVGEALTNLVWARITSLKDVKASCNWMWAAKLPGEGAKMWEACEALCDLMRELGPGIDGGKDSLSMSAQVAGETVKSPGQVTLTCYAACPDVRLTVTPDLKHPDTGVLLFIDISRGKNRLGGSALSTVFNQTGDECADVDDPSALRETFDFIQTCLDHHWIESGHDRSDGGLLVTLLEMAFAGNCGIRVNLPANSFPYGPIGALFSEELGLVVEVLPANMRSVVDGFKAINIPCHIIGSVISEKQIHVSVGGDVVLQESMTQLRDVWEATSSALEMRQCKQACAISERDGLKHRKGIPYTLTFDVRPTPATLLSATSKPRVAVIRQEGSNGDREMLSALYAAGLEPWDVNMRDLLAGSVELSIFRGIVFCGGFSYADVNDSAKGWAGVIRFNDKLLAQFESFRKRPDTFSLGICNGCQLMALLGWVPFDPTTTPAVEQPRFIHNSSGRFESRWVGIKILPSPAVLLQGMVGSTLGVWVAHGEGKAYFPNPAHLEVVEAKHMAPLRYVDDDNNVTSVYPMNPNGSPNGIAGMCSEDGRHLALMPHPERCFRSWQQPHVPQQWKGLEEGPWIKMFQNAQEFCSKVGK